MTLTSAITWVFWASVAVLLYTYLGFPLLLALRAALRPQPVRKGPACPRVSLLIAAHNEIDTIVTKLDNCLALDYPPEHLEIIVASDGSDDGTVEAVQAHQRAPVRLLALPRRGKNLTLNEAARSATGEILVFTDADTALTPESLRHLVAPFSDPEVGGVAGDFRYAAGSARGGGERTYWSIDRRWKRLQTLAGSVTSATGQLYALRRELFTAIPPGVTDDFFTSTQAVAAGRRLVFEPLARARGVVEERARAEFRRKVRVVTAGLRGVWAMRKLLNPLRYGFYSLQLASHKVLRRLMFLPILLLAGSTPLIWSFGWFYQSFGVAQIAFHGAAVLGWLLRARPVGRIKVLQLPFFFDMVNLAAALAVVEIAGRKRHDIWEPNRPGT